NVGNNEDSFLLKNVIGDGGGGAVGALADDFCFEVFRVAAGNDVFGGRRDKDFALGGENPFGISSLCGFEAKDRAIALAIFEEGSDVDAVWIIECAVILDHADDLIALFLQEMGRIGTNVAEALYDDSAAVALDVEIAEGPVADNADSAPGRFPAPTGAADVDGFAGHDAGDGLTHVHGVGIHDPGHDLLVGIDVGGGHVFFRPDEFDDFGGVAAGHALEFAGGHFFGIADHAALGSAEGDVDDGALPGHPTGESAYFVKIDVGCISDAAFGWAARLRMMHAEPGEDLDAAVIHGNWKVNDEFAGGIAKNLPEPLVEVELTGGEVEAGSLRFPWIDLLIKSYGRHSFLCSLDAPMSRKAGFQPNPWSIGLWSWDGQGKWGRGLGAAKVHFLSGPESSRVNECISVWPSHRS